MWSLFHRPRGSSTLEAAAVFAVLLPAFIVLMAIVERYQSYSYLSELIESALYDQKLGVDSRGGSLSELTPITREIVHEVSEELENYGFDPLQYVVYAGIVSFQVDSSSGHSNGVFRLLSEAQNGGYRDGDLNIPTIPEVALNIEKVFKNDLGTQIFTTSINSARMLESKDLFYPEANVLLIRVITGQLSRTGNILNLIDLNSKISYQQIVPLRFKLRI